MAQQNTPAAGSAFVYYPKAPRPGGYGDRTYHMVCVGVAVSRFPCEATASLTFRARESSGVCVFTRSLTADQCEDLARALIDAAADLRKPDVDESDTDETADIAAEAQA